MMPTDEILEYLEARIRDAQKERAQAVDHEKAYRAKADTEAQRVREFGVLVRHLEQWKRDNLKEENDPLQPHDVPPPKSVSAIPIRSVVRKILTEIDTFSNQDLYEAVQAKAPEAKRTSVYAELSICNKKGHVTRIDKGFYRSELFRGNRDEISEQVSNQREKEGLDEPDLPIGFGQVKEGL